MTDPTDDTAAWYAKREALLRSHATELYALSLEYARMKVFGMELRDGEVVTIAPAERRNREAALLVQLTNRAVRNLAYVGVHPSEPEAQTPGERHEARAARQRGL